MADQPRPAVFVGRHQELATLEGALPSERGDAPSIVLVRGPAGIGKTATVEHFLSSHAPLSVLRSHGMAWEQASPFGVVEHLLAGETPVSAGWGRDPADLAKLWSRSGQPHAVVVDDAHWADPESLRALASSFRLTSAAQVMLVLVIRDDEELPDDLAGYFGAHAHAEVPIGPLAAEDVRALAIQQAGVTLSPPDARRLTEHTDGNPRHILSLLHEVPAENWSHYQPILPAPQAFTRTTQHALRACSPAAQALVESAAVLGVTTSLAEAAHVAGIDDPIGPLDEATKAKLLGVAGGGDLTTIRFPCRMTRAAVYETLPPLRRRELHLRAAHNVEDESHRLLHRVAITPFPDTAIANELDELASRVAKLGAWSEAANALIHASRLSPARADRECRLVRAVDALVGAGDLPQAIAYSPALESFPETPLRDAVLGYLAIQLGRPAEADQWLSRAWEQCGPEDPGTAALICQRRVLHALCRCHGEELISWAQRAIELTGEDEPAAVESKAIIGLGLAAAGRITEATAAYDLAIAQIVSGAQAQRAQMGKGWLDLTLDEPLTARRELASAIPTEYRRGSLRISLWAQAWLARTEFALGAWDDALHTVNQAAHRADESGMELLRPLIHWTATQIHTLRGNWEEAYDHLQRASVTSHSYEVMLVPSCLARAHHAEAQADYHTVVRALEPLVHLSCRDGLDEPGFWPWHDVYANALVMTNQVEESDAFLAPYEALAAERCHRSTMARLGYVRGRIHGAHGDIESATESFEQALDQLQGLPLPYERARVHFAYGQTLRRAGKRREADTVLQTAREIYAALNAAVYIERCERELKAGGVHIRRTQDGPGELTPQESAVAKLVAAGMSNKQAATELYVSVKTVQFHLTRIYGKLGIHSRAELAAHFRSES